MAHGLPLPGGPPPLGPEGFDWTVWSAGSHPGSLSSHAVAVLAEIGIDIAHHWSKGLDDVPYQQADAVITLCAEQVCPVAPGIGRRLHWPLPDPAGHAEREEASLARFRAVRDELARRIEAFLADQGIASLKRSES